jgi:hypothetical protein
MTKDNVINMLNQSRYTFFFSLASILCILKDNCPSSIEKEITIDILGKEQVIKFPEFYDIYQEKKNRDILHESYLKAIFRTFIRESYELVVKYPDITPELKKSQIMEFTRITRNCLAHNFIFVFNNYDKEILPVTWNGKTIKKQMEGKKIDTDFLDFADGLELINDLHEFFRSKVK